jgi:spore coat polysaccharide biosynthesis protein SpsF
MKPEVVTVIQARTASSRLPGKVLLDIEGEPMLVRVVERVRRAQRVSRVVVATTTDPSDDRLAELCAERGFDCHRGSMHDVLDRFYEAARAWQADVAVRVTADCPLIDGGLIDQAVAVFLGLEGSGSPHSPLSELRAAVCDPSHPFDFVGNRLPPPWGRTFPIGLDVEVCSILALARTWREAESAHQREHVMPYLYEDPGRFRGLLLNHTADLGSLRWTVDTPEDLQLAQEVYAHFDGQDGFSWTDILELLEELPELGKINAGVAQKTAYDVDERSSADPE